MSLITNALLSVVTGGVVAVLVVLQQQQQPAPALDECTRAWLTTFIIFFFCLSLTVTTPSRGSQGAVFVDFAWFSLEVVLGCLDLDEILSVCLFIYEMNSCHIRALYDKG